MDEKEKQPEPKQMQVIKTERQLLCSRFSPDGTHLVAGGMDAKVHRWTEFEVELEDNDESKDKQGDKGVTQVHLGRLRSDRQTVLGDPNERCIGLKPEVRWRRNRHKPLQPGHHG